jgi:hypothetical protein
MSESQLPQLLFIGFKNTFYELISKALSQKAIDITFRDISSLAVSSDPSFSYDYIVIDCFSSENGILTFLRDTDLFHSLNRENEDQSKILILLPHTVSSEMRTHIESRMTTLLSENKSVGMLFVANLLDETLFSYFPLEGRTITLPHQASFFSFIKREDALHGIERNIFSLKAYGHTQSLYGIVIKTTDIAPLFEKKGYEITYDETIHTYVLSAQEVILKSFSLDTFIQEAPEVKKEIPLPPEKESDPLPIVESVPAPLEDTPLPPLKPRKGSFLSKLSKLRRKKSNHRMRFRRRKGLIVFGILLFFIILPYLLSGLALMTRSGVTSPFENAGKRSFRIIFSGAIAHASESVSTWYVQTPFGHLYEESLSWARIASRLHSAKEASVESFSFGDTLISLLVSNADLRNDDTTQKLLFAQESLYSDLGFATTETENLSSSKRFVTGVVDTQIIKKVQSDSLSYIHLLRALGSVTGMKKQTVYAVVLQDSDLLRPTGGKIAAIALAVFERGSLVTTEVLPLSDATKNFDGIVSPPLALTEYFGKTNWDLTESNWDYSFPISAEKIRWFIDKEFDRKVDGVLALSGDAVTQILSEDNRTTPESSLDKLTFGIQGIIDVLSQSDTSKKELFQKLLSDKQILISTSSDSANRALSEFGWNDSFDEKICTENCYADRFAINESTVSGKNKGIKREGVFQVVYQNNGFERDFTYYVKNEGEAEYQSYVRLVVPQDCQFDSVYLLNEDGKKELKSHTFGQRSDKENGVFVSIPQGKTIGISYSWKNEKQLSFDTEGDYELFIHKQPGVSPYPLDVKVSFPSSASLIIDSPFQLTKEGTVHYNTVLGADLNSSISWK